MLRRGSISLDSLSLDRTIEEKDGWDCEGEGAFKEDTIQVASTDKRDSVGLSRWTSYKLETKSRMAPTSIFNRRGAVERPYYRTLASYVSCRGRRRVLTPSSADAPSLSVW